MGRACRMHISVQWGKPHEKRLLGGPDVAEDDIKTNLIEIGWGGMDWIGFIWLRVRSRVFVNKTIGTQWAMVHISIWKR
jgi:hypothetical protein